MEEAALRWEAIDWHKVEAFVNKIQTRIASNRRFAATVRADLILKANSLPKPWPAIFRQMIAYLRHCCPV
jgi:hypothetical protein